VSALRDEGPVSVSHQAVRDQELVDRYTRGQLATDERLAFEEHFFTCEECFRELEMTDRFVGAVRHQAARNQLGPVSVGPEEGSAPRLAPAWLAGMAAAVAVSTALGGFAVWELKGLRGELGRAREDDRRSREAMIQDVRGAIEAAHRPGSVQPNLPVVALMAARSAEPPNEVRLPPAGGTFVLWIDVEDQPRGRAFKVELRSAGRTVTAAGGLVPNERGALTVGLDGRRLPAGDYRVALYAEDEPGRLRQEYALLVRP
jgi:hypothetical protein